MIIEALPSQPRAENVDEEIVAAITAAVSACLEKEAKETGLPVSGFVVRSIRRRV